MSGVLYICTSNVWKNILWLKYFILFDVFDYFYFMLIKLFILRSIALKSIGTIKF